MRTSATLTAWRMDGGWMVKWRMGPPFHPPHTAGQGKQGGFHPDKVADGRKCVHGSAPSQSTQEPSLQGETSQRREGGGHQMQMI